MAALAPVTWVVNADAFVLVKPEPKSDPEPSIKRKRGGGAVPSVTPGISWNKKKQKWTAYYSNEDGNKIHLGGYFDKGEAIKVAAPHYQVDRGASKWLGLCWSESAALDGGRWIAVCKHTYIARFKHDQEIVAARAYNVEAKRQGLTIFNDVPDPFDFVPREVKESTWTGVYWAGRSRDGSGGRWRVQCNNMYLGSFKYEEEHAAARCVIIPRRYESVLQHATTFQTLQ